MSDNLLQNNLFMNMDLLLVKHNINKDVTLVINYAYSIYEPQHPFYTTSMKYVNKSVFSYMSLLQDAKKILIGDNVFLPIILYYGLTNETHCYCTKEYNITNTSIIFHNENDIIVYDNTIARAVMTEKFNLVDGYVVHNMNGIYDGYEYDFYIELCGHLGDVVRMCFSGGIYHFLENNKYENSKILINIITFYNECYTNIDYTKSYKSIFKNYKNVHVNVLNNENFFIGNYIEERQKMMLPHILFNHYDEDKYIPEYINYYKTRKNGELHEYDKVTKYISNDELYTVNYLSSYFKNKYIVIHACSSGYNKAERTFPQNVFNKVIDKINEYGLNAYILGNSTLFNFVNNDNIKHLGEQLCISEVIELVKQSNAVICSHAFCLHIATTFIKNILLISSPKFVNENVNKDTLFFFEGKSLKNQIWISYNNFMKDDNVINDFCKN
jgi:hypothetical protein